MPSAQDLHDRLKALADEFRGTPGLAYHLAQLDGVVGHLRQTIKQQANAPAAAAAPAANVAPVEAPAAPEASAAPVAPPSPPAKPAPVVQVARPQASR